jgi:hypothetical protein
MKLKTRTVEIAGIASEPDGVWMGPKNVRIRVWATNSSRPRQS